MRAGDDCRTAKSMAGTRTVMRWTTRRWGQLVLREFQLFPPVRKLKCAVASEPDWHPCSLEWSSVRVLCHVVSCVWCYLGA